jgi:uracil-DNA glycosylase family 4
VGPHNVIDASDQALSALDWWQLAGVDVIVDEAPRDWLARAAPLTAQSIPAQPAAIADAVLPADLAAMHRALAGLVIPGAGDERLLPEGDPAAGLMIVIDMPDPEDALKGRLLSGAAGRLFDRMLGAIGRDRASIYLASVLPARPAGGQMDLAGSGEAVRLVAHHVTLAAPRAVMLCGDCATRALTGIGMGAARGRLHYLNQDGAKFPAIATFHPRNLLEHPMQKAGAWKDLQLLLGELEA